MNTLLRKLSIIFLLSCLSVSMSAKNIVIGLIPVENAEEMAREFEPMRVYLEKTLDEKVKVFTAIDYTSIIEAMRKKRVDIALFGPLSYYLAEKEANAEAFAAGVRKGRESHAYQSLLFVAGDSRVMNLEELRGKSAAFVDPASTSGSLVPSFLIREETGLLPQEFFGEFTYAGSHDASLLALKNKTVDMSASNSNAYRKMLRKGILKEGDLRILRESDPIPGSPMAYRKDLEPQLKEKIRTTFLNAHQHTSNIGYGNLAYYAAVSSQDYEVIGRMVRELNLTRDKLLK